MGPSRGAHGRELSPASRGDTQIARRSRARWILSSLVALALAGVLSLSAWSSAPNWSNVDSLYYQSMSLEVEGTSAQAARNEIFSSALARAAIRNEPGAAGHRWQSYEAQFSRRRWLVAALTAAVRPAAGSRALADVAIVGYLLFGLALFLLLASRFALVPSIVAMGLCLALGPTRNWGLRPMTDSWGLALAVIAILGSVVVLTRGRRWLPLWLAAMLALSFTRDLALIPLAGLAWLIGRDRGTGRRSSALLMIVTGILVTIPAYLVFGASLRKTLAFQMSGFEIPSAAQSTWGYIAAHYPSLLWSTAKADVHYAFVGHPVVGVSFATGIVALFAIPAKRDTLILVMRGAALGWLVVFALDPDFSVFRYELTLLPAVAVGLCALAEYVVQSRGRRRTAPVLSEPARS
jgi:hypothetical protein